MLYWIPGTLGKEKIGMRKTAKILFAAGTLTALLAFPALANFSWQVDNKDTDYVGTATVTLKD